MALQNHDLEDNVAKFLKEHLPGLDPRVLVDVGANEAWFSVQFLQQFPDLQSWMIEPSPPQFELLGVNLERFAAQNVPGRSHPFRLAFGMNERAGRISTFAHTTINHLVSEEEAGTLATAPVDVTTGDAFCGRHGLEHVDFLKIDAEGHDLQVLIGFKEMLSRQAVDFVQVEVGLSRKNKVHVPLATVSGLMEQFGYETFRLFNQCSWKRPILEWGDVVYISSKAADRLSDA
jgi:FkbM family methyltransferase